MLFPIYEYTNEENFSENVLNMLNEYYNIYKLNQIGINSYQ